MEAALLSETEPCNTPQHRDVSTEQRFGQEKITGLPGQQKTKVETMWNKKLRDDRWHDVDRSDNNRSTEDVSRQYFDDDNDDDLSRSIMRNMYVSINGNSLLWKPLAHCLVKQQLNIKDRHLSHITKGNEVTKTFANSEFFSPDLYVARWHISCSPDMTTTLMFVWPCFTDTII